MKKWTIFPVKASHAIQIINEDGACVATANNCFGSMRKTEENAMMIVAAPELLEALIKVKCALDVSTEVDRKYWSNQIEKVIKKTTK